MLIFTNDDYRRIQAWLKKNTIKDSDFAISQETVPEEDYTLLTSIVDCLSKGTCIIPFNILPKHTEPINNYLEDTPTRISEDDIIRLSQDDVLRLYNQ